MIKGVSADITDPRSVERIEQCSSLDGLCVSEGTRSGWRLLRRSNSIRGSSGDQVDRGTCRGERFVLSGPPAGSSRQRDTAARPSAGRASRRRPSRPRSVAERTGPSSKPDGTRPSFAGLPRSSPRPAWTRARSSSVSGSGADRRSMSSWTTRGSLSRLTPRSRRAAVSIEPLDSLPNDLNAQTEPTGPPGR